MAPRWYSSLVPNPKYPNKICLLESHDYNPNGFIIARDIIYDNSSQIKKEYACFPDYLSAYHWIYSQKPELRICYEIIPNTLQKPRFDIDIELDKIPANSNLVSLMAETYNALTSAINTILINHNIPYDQNKHLMRFNSHTNVKQSTHVIIDGFCHENKIEAAHFYRAVLAIVPKQYHQFIDCKVYCKNQQLRMLGNHKINKNNVKVFDPSCGWTSDESSEELRHLRLFEASLITFTAGCMVLPSFAPKDETIKQTSSGENKDIDVHYNEVVDIFKNWRHHDRFTIRGPSNNKLVLNGDHASECPVHNRVHEHENAYINISSKGYIYFNCGRNERDERGTYLGKLNQKYKPLVEEIYDNKEDDKTSTCDALGCFCLVHRRDISLCKEEDINNINNNTKSSELIGIDSNNIMSVQHIHINNDNTGQTLQKNINIPFSREFLINFINYHIIKTSNHILKLSDFIETFKKYCIANCIIYGYRDDQGRGISRDLSTIAPSMVRERKTINGTKQQVIIGCKLNNLHLLSTNNQLLPVSQEIIMKSNAIEDMQLMYDTIQPDFIPGYEVDMSPVMPGINSITNGRQRYVAAIVAPLGFGKTEVINSELTRLGINNKTSSFLMVAARITLNKKQQRDMAAMTGVITYDDVENSDIRGSRILVTYNSLYRVKGKFDFLVLDEYLMTLSQAVEFNDSNSSNRNVDKNFRALMERIKLTPKVIIADAFLKESSLKLLRKLRDDVIVYQNGYPKHETKNVNVISDITLAYLMINNDVKNRLKLVISCGSRDTVKGLAKILSQLPFVKIYKGDDIPDEKDKDCYKVKYYTSKEVIRVDPTEEWASHVYDCAIHSSVLESGNSFAEKYFDKAYGLFTGRSFGPDPAAQMLLRARVTKLEEINICVQDGYNEFPESVQTKDQMKDYIVNKNADMRRALFNVIPMSVVTEEMDYNDNYFEVFTDVKYRGMIGKRNYLWTLLGNIKKQGIKFGKYIDEGEYAKMNNIQYDDDGNGMEGLMKTARSEIRMAKKSARMDDCNVIAEAMDISDELAAEVSKRRVISSAERAALDKHYIKKRYKTNDLFKLASKYSEPFKPNDKDKDKDGLKYKRDVQSKFIDMVMDKRETHTNITRFAALSGVVDNNEIIRIMKEISEQFMEKPIIDKEVARKMDDLTRQIMANMSKREYIMGKALTGVLNKEDEIIINDCDKEINRLGDEINELEKKYDTKGEFLANRLSRTTILEKQRRCIHAVNIMRKCGFVNWMRTEENSNNRTPFISINEAFGNRITELNKYITENISDFVGYVPVMGTYDDKDITKFKEYINSVLNVAFNMKINYTKSGKGYYLKSFWQKDMDGIIRPVSYNPGVPLN